jgi:hypothetical protein
MPAFAGWKLAAWLNRQAPRDLYDLWALGRVGALNNESARLFAKHGPTNGPPQPWMFHQAPTAAEWQTQLVAQTRLTITADEALRAVRETWTKTPGGN